MSKKEGKKKRDEGRWPSVSFQKGEHRSFVIGRSLGQIRGLVLLHRLPWCLELSVCPPLLICSLSTGWTLILGGGVVCLGPVPAGRVFLLLSRRDQSKTVYLSCGFRYLPSGGQKADFITPGGLAVSVKKQERRRSMWREM